MSLSLTDFYPALTGSKIWLKGNDVCYVGGDRNSWNGDLVGGPLNVWENKSIKNDIFTYSVDGNQTGSPSQPGAYISNPLANTQLSGVNFSSKNEAFNHQYGSTNVKPKNKIDIPAGNGFSVFVVEEKATNNNTGFFIAGRGPRTINNMLHIGYANNTTFRFGFIGNDLDYTNASISNTNTTRQWTCISNSTNTIGRRIRLNGVQVASDTYLDGLASDQTLCVAGVS